MLYKHINEKSNSTYTTPEMNSSNSTISLTDKEKLESPGMFFSSVFTKETPRNWNDLTSQETHGTDNFA